MNRPSVLLSVAVVLMFAACTSSSSDKVLDKRQMSDLLIDIHRAESIVEYDNGDFRSDSARQLMQQSVLAKHGVTQAQFDSSLVYYGHHIEDYLEIYDRVAERFESDLREMEISGQTDNSQVELAGDSVDVWSSGRLHRFTPLQASDALVFNLRRDGHWEKGDIYLWKFRVPSGSPQSAQWTIVAEYPDNTYTSLSGSTMGQGWQYITFPTDTLQMPRALRGFIRCQPRAGAPAMVVDSIALSRVRLGRRGVYVDRQPIRINIGNK